MKQNEKIFNLNDFLINYRPHYVKIQNDFGDAFISFFSVFLVSFLFAFSASITIDSYNLDLFMLFSNFEYIKEQGFIVFFISFFHVFCFLFIVIGYVFSLYYIVKNFFKLSNGVFNFKTFSIKKMEKLSIKDFRNKIKLFDTNDLLLLISSENFKKDFSKEDKKILIDTIREMKIEKATKEKKETVFIENY